MLKSTEIWTKWYQHEGTDNQQYYGDKYNPKQHGGKIANNSKAVKVAKNPITPMCHKNHRKCLKPIPAHHNILINNLPRNNVRVYNTEPRLTLIVASWLVCEKEHEPT